MLFSKKAAQEAVLLLKMTVETLRDIKIIPDMEPENEGFPKPLLQVFHSEEMIEAMGEGQWRLPTQEDVKKDVYFSITPSTDFRGLIQEWVTFCDLVMQGQEMMCPPEGEASMWSISAIGAWAHAKEVLGGEIGERKKLISGAGRAFGALLDKGVKMKPGDTHKARKLVEIFKEWKLVQAGVPPFFIYGTSREE